MVRQRKSQVNREIFTWRIRLLLVKQARRGSGKVRSIALPCCLHKKSLCVENAEANSERNLYNPPSGLVLSLHIPVKASFLIRLTPFFSFHLKCNIETGQSQMMGSAFPAFFCGPIKVGTGAREHSKSNIKRPNSTSSPRRGLGLLSDLSERRRVIFLRLWPCFAVRL